MKHTIFLIGFFVVYIFSFSQNSKKVSIVDIITKRPIPYTTIRSNDFKVGAYANHNGIFELIKEFKDSLCVSSVGYISKKISIDDLDSNMIYLEPQIALLSPIMVRTLRPFKEEKFGILSAKKSIVWSSSGFGDEFAQKIVFADSTGVYRLKKVTVAAERFEPEIPMLLHVYNTGPDGLPGEDLLRRKVLFTKGDFKKRKKEFELDISADSVLIAGSSCFIGVEWLPVNQKKLPSTALLLTSEISGQFTYSRAFFYTKDKWGVTLRTVNQQNPNNTIISVTVEILQ